MVGVFSSWKSPIQFQVNKKVQLGTRATATRGHKAAWHPQFNLNQSGQVSEVAVTAVSPIIFESISVTLLRQDIEMDYGATANFFREEQRYCGNFRQELSGKLRKPLANGDFW